MILPIPYTALAAQPRTDLRQSPLPLPLNLYCEMTNACQYRCTCCPESLPNFFEAQGGKHRLRAEDWESVASKIEALTAARPVLHSLHFYMLGEPLVNPNTCAFIADATERRLSRKTLLTTNGLLVERYALPLATSGLTYLRVSLYEQYSNDWPAIATGLRALRSLRVDQTPFIYVKAFDNEDAVKTLFAGVADEIEIVGTMNWNGTATARLGDDRPGRKVCPMPFYTLVIHSDLRVSVCCVDWDKRLIVGDLRQQTLAEVWNSDEMHDIRLKHLAGRQDELDGCRNCTIPQMLQDSVEGLSSMEYSRRVYGSALRAVP